MRNIDIFEAVDNEKNLDLFLEELEREWITWFSKIDDPPGGRKLAPPSKRFLRGGGSSWKLNKDGTQTLGSLRISIEFSGNIARDMNLMVRKSGKGFTENFIVKVFDKFKNKILRAHGYKVVEDHDPEITYGHQWKKPDEKIFTLEFGVTKCESYSDE